jgi:hypothetical protein
MMTCPRRWPTPSPTCSASPAHAVDSPLLGGHRHRRHVQRQRYLPPSALALTDRRNVDDACRPLADFPVHRRQLHPIALLAMPPRTGTQVLTVVCTGAAAGVALKMLWPSAPRWLGVPRHLLLGWAAIWFQVPPLGLEPRTCGLKVRSSTN